MTNTTPGQGNTVLIVTTGGVLAHVVRCLMVARPLRELGYRVLFAGDGKPLLLARRAGFEVRPLPDWDPDWVLAHISEGPRGLHPIEQIERWVQEELALLEEVQPAAVLDDFRLTAGISAAVAGLPRISLLNAHLTRYAVNGLLDRSFPCPPSAVGPGAEESYNRVRQRYDLPPLENSLDLFIGDLNLMCDVPEYDPVCNAPDHYRYVGPLTWENDVPIPPWLDRLDPERPTIYLTMGSTGPLEAFKVAMAAFAGSEYQVLMTVGSRVQLEDLLPAPPHFHLACYAPGDQLARRADVVICHGGNGTTYQALSAGTPIIASPFLTDQHWNAWRQAELGVGFTLPALTPEAMREAVAEAMGNPSYQEVAGRFRDILTNYDGPQTAARLIHEYLSGD